MMAIEDRAKKLLRKARATNARRDQVDHKSGFAPPGEHPDPAEGLFRTALAAIDAGLSMANWDCVAEGQVFLHQYADCVGMSIPPYTRHREE